jgi:hypothetical protein
LAIMTAKTLLFASVLVSWGALLGGCRAGSTSSGTTDPESTASASDAAGCERTGRVLRRPVVRMDEHGAWGTPIQSAGIPTFSLYEDGLLVYAHGQGENAKAMQVRLSPDEVYALVDLANAKIGALPPDIRVSQASDQPEAAIGVTHEGRIYHVRVYGFDPEQSSIPAAFVELHDKLQSYTHPQAQPWQPDELEVAVWRRDDLKSEAQAWPDALPLPPEDAREPRARALGRKSIPQPIRYRVDGEFEAALDDVLPAPGELQAFAWRGSAWMVRTERVVPAMGWYR